MTKKQEAVKKVIEDTRKHTVEVFAKTIEEKGMSWVCEWERKLTIPRNGAKNTRYNGINTAHLMAIAYEEGYEDGRWFTYKQAQELGYHPAKGEKAAHVEYWKLVQYDKTVEDEEGNEETQHREFWRPVAWFNVFNAHQLVDEDNKPMKLEAKPKYKRLNKEQVEIANRLIETSRCAVHERTRSGSAFYSPMTDAIVMPSRKKFKNMKAFIATLTHEMTHSTAKPMNRKETGRFGTQTYAYEELVAELGSVFVCMNLGVQRAENLEHDKNFENHAAYLQNWLQVLKKNPDMLFKAANDAGKAADYIIERYEGKEEAKKKQAA